MKFLFWASEPVNPDELKMPLGVANPASVFLLWR